MIHTIHKEYFVVFCTVQSFVVIVCSFEDMQVSALCNIGLVETPLHTFVGSF